MASYPLELDLTIDLLQRRNTIFVGILPVIRPKWRRSDVIFQEYSTSEHWQGYKMAVPGSKDAIILKLYTSKFGPELYERSRKAHKLLNEMKIGPRLLVIFANAIIVECIPGKSLYSGTRNPGAELLEPENLERLAETLATVHSRRILEKAEKWRVETNFDGIYVDDEKCRYVLEEMYVPNRLRGKFPKLAEFKTEIGRVSELLRALKCTKSLCYMDLNPQNIYQCLDGSLTIVEHDFTCISYSVVDLAAPLQCFTKVSDPKRDELPNETVITYLARCYLEARARNEGREAGEEELDRLLLQIRAGRLLVLLRLTMLGPLIKGYCDTNSPYDYLTYGRFCWDLYQEMYEEVVRDVEKFTGVEITE